MSALDRPEALCLFDLDDTLLPLDSDHAWGEFVMRLGWVDEAEFRRRNDDFYADYKAGRLDIHAYIDFATAAAAGPPGGRVRTRRTQRFMAEVIAPALRPAALRAGASAPGPRRPVRARHRDQRLHHRPDRARVRHRRR